MTGSDGIWVGAGDGGEDEGREGLGELERGVSVPNGLYWTGQSCPYLALAVNLFQLGWDLILVPVNGNLAAPENYVWWTCGGNKL